MDWEHWVVGWGTGLHWEHWGTFLGHTGLHWEHWAVMQGDWAALGALECGAVPYWAALGALGCDCPGGMGSVAPSPRPVSPHPMSL